MKRVFLIDYENVNECGLNGLFDIGSDDCAYIFYTDKSNKISFDFLEQFSTENKGREIKFLKSVAGKNALDFQLASFLGSIIEKNGIDECEYIIISKDNGFCCLPAFWTKEKSGIKICCAPSITRVISSAKDKPEPLHDEAVIVPESAIEPEAEESNLEKESEDGTTAQQKQKTNKANKKTKQMASQERVALNTAVQQAMSGAKYDAKTISDVASFATKTYKESKGKKEVYTWLIQKYKRNKGLEIYNIIKPALK